MWITFLQQWNNNQQKHSLCLPGKLQVESGQCEVPSSFLSLSENCKKTKIQRLFYCLHVFLNEEKKISNTFMKTKQFSAFLNLFYHKVTFFAVAHHHPVIWTLKEESVQNDFTYSLLITWHSLFTEPDMQYGFHFVNKECETTPTTPL